MKQTIWLAAFYCGYVSNVGAQTETLKNDTVKYYNAVADSLAYMEDIVANKQKYINQPLSVLLNDLKIPVQSFSQHHTKRESLGIVIYFDSAYNSKEEKEKWNNWNTDLASIIIEWTISLLRLDIENYLQKGAGKWTNVEQSTLVTK